MVALQEACRIATENRRRIDLSMQEEVMADYTPQNTKEFHLTLEEKRERQRRLDERIDSGEIPEKAIPLYIDLNDIPHVCAVDVQHNKRASFVEFRTSIAFPGVFNALRPILKDDSGFILEVAGWKDNQPTYVVQVPKKDFYRHVRKIIKALGGR